MESFYKELLEQINVRKNLSALRQWLKEGGSGELLSGKIKENEELFLGFLENEDPKTRKNAALLFGDLAYESAVDSLFAAYEKEETLFVRSSYLEALDSYQVERIAASSILPGLKGRLEELQQVALTEENRKHVEEELRSLRKLLIRCEGIEKHQFDMKQRENRILLVTNRIHREVVRKMVEEYGHTAIHPLGVLVETDNLYSLLQVRTYREMLFLDREQESQWVSKNPEEAAQMLAPWMLKLCRKYHVPGPRQEADSFYFRVECKSHMTLEERSRFTKRLGARLEQISGGSLVNSTGDYEVELRLIENREGMFFPCIRFCAMPDHRFDYRKHAISASIHPSTAALIMELARPFMQEKAQLMDPFCGVGTMLIERDIAVPAGDKYATDIFGTAIEMGRENARLAGEKINFIHRDFFDFHHEYQFDEIITNMPLRGKKSKEEMDRLYERFFSKALEILKREALIVMYTNEVGFVKKQLRLHREFRLLQETAMQKKTGFYLLIIGVMR